MVCLGLWCAHSTAQGADGGVATDLTHKMAPVFVDAHVSGDLATWAQANTRDGRLVRLPFTFWVNPAVVMPGVHAGAPPAHAGVTLQDAPLGIPLADHVRRACAGRTRCVLVLAVRAGGGALARTADFTVMEVLGAVPDDAPDAAVRPGVQRPVTCLLVRRMAHVHCARGPARCERCREAARKPAQWALLDLCGETPAARPTVSVQTPGGPRVAAYDVLMRFASDEAARAYAAQHGVPVDDRTDGGP